MSALEALKLVRPAPVLTDTPDYTDLLDDILRLQACPVLELDRRMPPSLQAVCLQAACTGWLRLLAACDPPPAADEGPEVHRFGGPENKGEAILDPQEVRSCCPEAGWLGELAGPLEVLPPPLARLMGDLLFAELSAEDWWSELLLDVAVTAHTSLAWVRPGFSVQFYRRQARTLRRRAPRLRELHFERDMFHREIAEFLAEFAAEPACPLAAVCGPPALYNSQLLLQACPRLRRLELITASGFTLPQITSSSLSYLDLRTNVPVDLATLDQCLPQLMTFKLQTWYKCSGDRRPKLYAPHEVGETQCCARLAVLEVLGYNIGSSLQVQLPSLRSLTLKRCTVNLVDVFRHNTLERLELKLLEDRQKGDLTRLQLPALTELDLHSQWGDRRTIDLSLVNANFPELRSLTLRFDFYDVIRSERGRERWFPNLQDLTLLYSPERYEHRPDQLFSAKLRNLRRLCLKRCHLFADLIAIWCPYLETLDLKTVVTEANDGHRMGVELPSVHHLAARLCSDVAIRDICRMLPALRAVGIQVGYLEHETAAGYRKVVEELSRRNITVSVTDE